MFGWGGLACLWSREVTQGGEEVGVDDDVVEGEEEVLG